MSWFGYERMGQVESRPPICRVVLDLFDTTPGGAAVSIQMGEPGGSLPDSQQDRAALAEVLRRELMTALNELLVD